MWMAPCREPGCFCASLFCFPCVGYHLRRRVLYNDLRNYLCCGGYCPCSGKMCEQNCPHVCLAMEVTLCYAQSVFVTRFMIQDEMHIQNTQCDNCIIVRGKIVLSCLLSIATSCGNENIVLSITRDCSSTIYLYKHSTGNCLRVTVALMHFAVCCNLCE